MPSLADAYTGTFGKKKANDPAPNLATNIVLPPTHPPAPSSSHTRQPSGAHPHPSTHTHTHTPSTSTIASPPPPPPSTCTASLAGVNGAPVDAEEVCRVVSGEALDALNTIQVLRMATQGNLMAEDFVSKLDHHLRSIVTRTRGEKHWPEKYRAHFVTEEPEAEAAQEVTPRSVSVSRSASTLSLGQTLMRKASSLLSPATDGAPTGAGGEIDLTEGERLGSFEFAELEEDDDDEDVKESRKSTWGVKLLSSPRRPANGTKSKRSASANEKANDVDIYNIINAEEKDKGVAKRKGLALGGALSHSIKNCLFSDTCGSKATKHPPTNFTQIRPTDVTFQDVTFSFQEYAPVIFLSMREHFGLDNTTFTKSMSELKGGQVGEGKSGMLFFSTADREFIVKTVTKNEMRFLERELKSYYDYMVVNGATTLLPRFVGLYFLKLPDKPIIRVIVMNNVFKLPRGKTIELVEMYDLKGSLHTRYVGAEEAALGKVSVLKDLNFCNRHHGTDSHGREIHATEGPCRGIYLGPIRKIELLANLQSDVEWLRQHNIMDYSLLLAVGFEVSPDEPAPPTSKQNPSGDSQAAPASPKWQNAWSVEMGGVRGMNGDFTERAEVYYMGVIDILQEYNAKKRAEHTLKSFTADSTKISAVDPDFYAERFLGWMEQHVL